MARRPASRGAQVPARAVVLPTVRVVAALALVAVAAAPAGPSAARAAPRVAPALGLASPLTGATAPAPHVTDGWRLDPAAPALGVNVDVVGMPAAERDALLERLRDVGVRYVRQPARWAEIEATRGQPEWGELDAAVEAVRRAGLALLLTIETSPDWSRTDPAPAEHLWLCEEPAATRPASANHAPPSDPDDLAQFAGAVAARYRGRIGAVEIWSEPNLLPNWRRTGPDPEEYGRYLERAAASVRSAAPETLVVSAGLAPTTDVGVCYLSDYVFLERLAASGALATVDAVGIEPFGLRDEPGDARRDREVLNFGRAQVLWDVLRRRNVDRPLWAVAWGWRASAEGEEGSNWGGQSPDVAARWIGQGWALARAEWPWMGPMFLWRLRPGPGEPAEQWGYAIVDASGAPTALWSALREIASGASQKPEVPPPSSRIDGRLVAAAVAAACVLLLLFRRLSARLGAALARWIRRMDRRSDGAIGAVFALGVVCAAVGPWPVSAAAVPAMILAAAVRPNVALAAVAAAAPFYYRLHLHLGPRPVGLVEALIGVAVAGHLLSWLARRAAPVESGAGRRPAPESAEGAGAALTGGPQYTPGAPSRRAALATLRRRAVAAIASRMRHVAAVDGLVAALVAWAALSLSWTVVQGPAMREWRTVILEPAVFYAMLRISSDRGAAAQAALDGAVLGGILAGIWGVAGAALGSMGLEGLAVSAEGVIRARGPYGSPNNLALYLGRILPVVATQALWGNGPRRRLHALAAIPIVLAILATFSRGALVIGLPVTAAYLLALVVLVRPEWRRTVALSVIGAAALVAAALAPFAGSRRLAGAFDLSPGSTLYIRTRLWRSSLAMLSDHPALGVGLDNFLPQYRDIYVRRDAVQERFLSHPHNWVLDWWLRLGVVGLLLFAGIVAGNIAAGVQALRRRGAAWAAAAGALGMQFYALSHGLVDNAFFLVDLALLWWIAQATLLADRAHKSD